MTEHVNRAVVLLPGQGRGIDLGNFAMSLKADGQLTAGMFSLLEAAEPAGFGPPMHVHTNAAEAFYVLDGTYHIFIEETAHDCPPGSFVFIPAGVTHGFRVGSTPGRKLNFYAPAAMVGYFDELSEALQTGDADAKALAEIAQRYGMDIIGPVPEGYL